MFKFIAAEIPGSSLAKDNHFNIIKKQPQTIVSKGMGSYAGRNAAYVSAEGLPISAEADN
jgi:hypothetical protein